MSWVDPNAASPLQVPGLPALKGGLEFASPSQRSPYNVDPMNFGPRIGLAYRGWENVVVRTGYGIFFDPIKGAAAGTGGGGFTGFNFTTPLVTTYNNDGGDTCRTTIRPVAIGSTRAAREFAGLIDWSGSRCQRTDSNLEQHALHSDLEFRIRARV